MVSERLSHDDAPTSDIRGRLDYLIATFFAPARRTELLVTQGFTRPHILDGRVAATGQDGKQWIIVCDQNDVRIENVCGPAPSPTTTATTTPPST